MVLLGMLAAPGLKAQDDADAADTAEEAADPLQPKLEFGLEAKASFRDSDDFAFPVNFGFGPEEIPSGQTRVFERTVNPGQHFEFSAVTLLVDASWGEGLTAHTKIDFIDLYDRNPTSTDHKVDVDEAWLRFGREAAPATLAEKSGAYLKVGKFPHFERQNDRHLESYGLVSTAFNRFEDIGAELGVDLGRHLYLKVSATQGNPVFLRDPNALAGDHGTPAELEEHPVLPLNSGVVIFYDAEAEDIDLDGDLEVGGGLGLRFADEAGRNGIDFLAWAYRRTLAARVALEGSFYGGDLDLLNGPRDPSPLPIRGDEKKEAGANLWAYWNGLTFFGQYVDQKVAGLGRTGIEGELAWRFDLPLVWALGDRQLFPSIAPSVRYSNLDNDFRNVAPTPAPSFAWDWRKVDYGLRLAIVSGTDLTLEYADNRFILGNGRPAKENELLATLRWKI
jgi:hypothetical protein